MLETDLLGRSLVENYTDMEVILADSKLNTSQQVALATKKIARIFWAAIGKVLPAG